jgi:hypothetical protein
VPVWNPEEQVTLTKHDEEIQVLTDRWADIKKEALHVAANLSDSWLTHVRTTNDQVGQKAFVGRVLISPLGEKYDRPRGQYCKA